MFILLGDVVMLGCNPCASNVHHVELYISVFLLLKILQFNFFGSVAHRVVISGIWPLSWLDLHVLIYHAGTNCKALSLD